MLINGHKVDATQFAYDGNNKMYLIEDTHDLREAKMLQYEILDIKQLPETYNKASEFKFISNWKLGKKYVGQFEQAKFETVKEQVNMKKEYCIQVDVTMSGNVYVEASSKEEAIAMVDKMNFRASDLTNFYQIDAQVVDVEE